MVGNSIKLSNARTTATVFDTKMSPPRRLCQQQILPECAKSVRCSVTEAQDAPWCQNCGGTESALRTKNYVFFMIPKHVAARLSINMQSTDTSWQTWLQPHQLAAFATESKESTLKLSLETRNRGDILIVHCQG